MSYTPYSSLEMKYCLSIKHRISCFFGGFLFCQFRQEWVNSLDNEMIAIFFETLYTSLTTEKSQRILWGPSFYYYYYYYYYYYLRVFSPPVLVNCFSQDLSDNKSPQGSKTFHSIRTDLNNNVFWMVSILLLISKSSNFCGNTLVTLPSVSFIIGIRVTSTFHSFLIVKFIIILFLETFSYHRLLTVSYWVWVTGRLPMSSGLFSVFWLIVIMR